MFPYTFKLVSKQKENRVIIGCCSRTRVWKIYCCSVYEQPGFEPSNNNYKLTKFKLPFKINNIIFILVGLKMS